MKILKAQMSDMGTEMGAVILPIVVKTGAAFIGIADAVGKFISNVKWLVENATGGYGISAADIVVGEHASTLEKLAVAVAHVVVWLRDEGIPAFQKFATETRRAIGDVWTEVQPKIAAFVAWVGPKLQEFGAFAQVEFAKFQVYYEEDIKPALENIQAAIEGVINWTREHWPEIEKIVRPVLEQVQLMIETSAKVITAYSTSLSNSSGAISQRHGREPSSLFRMWRSSGRRRWGTC